MLSVRVPRSPFKVCGHHKQQRKILCDPAHMLFQEKGSFIPEAICLLNYGWMIKVLSIKFD